MAERYQYQYLVTGYIRVLRILSISPEIRFEFDVVSLDSYPHYHALSYVWGTEGPSRAFVDGRYIDITPNLDVCLQHLGEHFETRIWIDALCINQQDNEEKSRQVLNMSRIYGQASRVLVWLGPSSNDSDLAIDSIERYGKLAFEAGLSGLGREYFSTWPDVGDDPERVKVKDTVLALMETAAGAEDSVDRAAERFARIAFAALTNREYFNRVWVKQEVTLAKDSVVLCGHKGTNVDHFHTALLFYGLLLPWEINEWRAGRMERVPGPFSIDELMAAESPYSLLETTHTNSAAGHLFGGRREYQKGTKPSLYYHLDRSFVRDGTSSLRSTNSSDKIFGLLGIARDAEELGIMPDYSKTAEEVYETAARALIRQGHIDILKWCRTARGTLPSWVPNWDTHIRFPWSEDGGKPLFMAAGATLQPKALETTIITPRSILLHGSYVDTITALGSVWVSNLANPFDQTAFRRMVTELKVFLKKCRYSTDQCSNAIWRIPVGDKEMHPTSAYLTRATERAKEQFEVLLSTDMNEQVMIDPFSYQTAMGYNYLARPIISEDGLVGLGPSGTVVGDVIVFFYGGSTPFIVRPRPGMDAGYVLIGEAYVYGAMDGEMMEPGMTETVFELW
ncbi:hypothetical protein MKZ38_002289 [Zalerion maritima]|uniref:Heterokaryon incompatibility domain-containing protein n=1 Tax=Zalerion maritima TaxID=339359 RepID=A0AAD5RP08_9PEZI|nr:hypothetical protein MKZ38_002289 [Zalerion maritima]